MLDLALKMPAQFFFLSFFFSFVSHFSVSSTFQVVADCTFDEEFLIK